MPYTMRLANGRTVFVLIPAEWTDTDRSGELALKPPAVRMLDKVQALAMDVPAAPTPGFIRTLRDALGLTQRQLGERVGVDKMTVSRWERGAVKPGPESVKALDKLRRQCARKGILVA